MSETMVNKEQRPAEVAGVERTQSGRTYSPRFDIWETEDELILYGDLPGVRPESLDVEFENDVLTIHGKVESRQKDIEFINGEYGIGDFYRTFAIGESIDKEKIAAEMHNGVLTLHLPKAEAIKPRRIKVKAK
jgi:HSP20 family molecular chaperone IbpA